MSAVSGTRPDRRVKLVGRGVENRDEGLGILSGLRLSQIFLESIVLPIIRSRNQTRSDIGIVKKQSRR